MGGCLQTTVIEQHYETKQNVIVGSSGYFGAVTENMDLRTTDVIDWDLIVC